MITPSWPGFKTQTLPSVPATTDVNGCSFQGIQWFGEYERIFFKNKSMPDKNMQFVTSLLTSFKWNW